MEIDDGKKARKKKEKFVIFFHLISLSCQWTCWSHLKTEGGKKELKDGDGREEEKVTSKTIGKKFQGERTHIQLQSVEVFNSSSKMRNSL